jgi:hypothetical protein
MLLACFLLGCQLSNKPSTVNILAPLENQPKHFVLFSAREYEGDIVDAFASNGFAIKPIAIRQELMEAEGPTKIVKYKESGSRYRLKFAIKHDYNWLCAFSSGNRVNVMMSVIDIAKKMIYCS